MQAGTQMLSSNVYFFINSVFPWLLYHRHVHFADEKTVLGGWGGETHGWRGTHPPALLCPVGVSLPDATALSASPFGPWLWDH